MKTNNEQTRPAVGDYVEYVNGYNLCGGILADIWESPLTGDTRCRVVDFHREIKDEEAGRDLYYKDVRLPRD